MERCAVIARGFLTIVLIASWNLATTHCAFAAAVTGPAPTVQQDAADECPMHASKKPAPEPQKRNGCPDVPCCKTLPATSAAKSLTASKSPESFRTFNYIRASADPLELQPFRNPLLALDTGPPAPNKFIEVIFRRSIPAHAPPGTW
jgi:hypothetical protein